MANSSKASVLQNFKTGRRQFINLAIVLLVLYVVLPQLGKFRASLDVLRHAHFAWIAVALGCSIVTSLVASGIYLLLAKKRLRYVRTLTVQLASLFVNRLLPAGVGALGLNFEYLRKQRHARAAAGAVVATNNLLGLLGHALLLGTIILTTSISLTDLAHPHLTQTYYWLALAILVLIMVILFWFRKSRSELYRSVLGTLKDIRGYRAHSLKVAGALGLSIGLTSLYCFCLLACAYAVGLHLSFGQALIVLTVGVAGGTIAPTPGGLIGAEAGLFAGLLAYKVPSAQALAVVLAYRFITYWLALAIGAVAWIFIRQRNYI